MVRTVAACLPLLTATGCGGEAQPAPCATGDVTACHAHLDLHLSVTGSVSFQGDVARDAPEGVACSSLVVEGTVWTAPFPSTPAAVDGHFFFGQGSLLASDNTGPGTYAASLLTTLEFGIDDLPLFTPGAGSINLDGRGGGSMALTGFDNGSASVNLTANWSCEDVAN